ncbi:MAG: glycosyltransferase [Acidimicrobiales bacterium]
MSPSLPGHGRPRLVSIVVPVRNAAGVLADQLAALAGQRYRGEREVVIVDNGSTDGSAEVAAAWSERLPLHVVSAPAPAGINVARNAGAAAARGELLVFCDADDVVAPGWLAAMASTARWADIVGGPLDEATLNRPDQRAWRPPTPATALPRALRFLPYAPGGNLAVWAEVWRALGGFDERFSVGGTEIEFCWRAQLAGCRLGFASGAVVRVRHRASLPALARQFHRYGMAQAQLYAHFRADGVPPSQAREALRDWWWATRAMANRRQRPEALRVAALRAGRLRGSARHRVLFP